MTRILLVDDHPLVVEGLKSLLANIADVTVVGSAANAADTIDFLQRNAVDVVFLDIQLPDESGITLCKKIREQFPDVKSLALSTFSERSYIARMIQNGAMGYLIKSSSKEEILEAIHQVRTGGYYTNVNLANTYTIDRPKTLPFLTRREKEVLGLIAEGLTNQQIANKIFVSVTTINSHRKNLLMKFDVTNTAALIKLAVQNGLI